MTALAHAEVVTTKGAFAIVTSHTALTTTGGVMVERLWPGDLLSLGQTSTHLMTFVAGFLLMFGVTKADTEGLHEFRRARVPTQLMTGAARRDVAPARGRPRCMTSIAGRVRIEARRDRHRDTRTRRPMTGIASHAAHVDVPRVIELHAKAAQTRKRFERTRLHIGVTDRANRAIGVRKLLRVTAGTGKML